MRKGRTLDPLGYVPPQAIEIEQVVLGAMMLEKGSVDQVMELLPTDAFYKDTHQMIYSAIKKLSEAREPIDILTVTNALKKSGELDTIGGPFVITELTSRVASAANIEYHCRIILEKYARRKIMETAIESYKAAVDDTQDIFNILSFTDTSIQAVGDTLTGTGGEGEYQDMLTETVEKIETLAASDIKVSGVPTSNPKLDSITGGWQKTDLIILSGRPGSGKSTRALVIAKAALLAKKSVAMFSLEMSAQQIIHKQINDEAEVMVKDLRSGTLNQYDIAKIKEAAKRLYGHNFYLNDKSGINLNYISAVCRKRKKKFGLDLVVVDYLQLIRPVESYKGKSRENEVSEISSGLKRLAKDLDVPVIALSQLSRQVEQRADKRPSLSDLRESGAVEQDADVVFGLYRPSYYYTYLDDPDYKGESMPEDEYKMISELHILKNRNGETGIFIKEKFSGALSRFWSGEEPTSITPNKQAEGVPF